MQVIDPHITRLRDKILTRFLAAKAVKAVDALWQEPDSDRPAEVLDNSGRPVASAADGAIADHIAMNDPRTVIETSLADLAILAEHASIDVQTPSGTVEPQCRTCKTKYPCRTVHILHDGYSFLSPWSRY